MTRALLITNPAAARTDARAVAAIRDTLLAGGWSAEGQATAKRGDAPRFARDALERGLGVLESYGGDGPASAVWRGGACVGAGRARPRGWRSAPRRGPVAGTVKGRGAPMVLGATGGGLIPPFLRLRHDVAPDDGWLDVLALDADGALESVLAFWELARGSNGARGESGRLWFARGRSVRVETLAGGARPVQLDGEVTGVTPFEVRLLPGALSVLVAPARVPRRSAPAALATSRD